MDPWALFTNARAGSTTPSTTIRMILSFVVMMSLAFTVIISVICFTAGAGLVGYILLAYAVYLLYITLRARLKQDVESWALPFLVLNLLLWPAVQIMLGGAMASGAIVIWSSLSPLGASFRRDRTYTRVLFNAFMVLISLVFTLEFLGLLPAPVVHDRLGIFLFGTNIFGVFAIAFLAISNFLYLVWDMRKAMKDQQLKIISSIEYARHIQVASLPSSDYVRSLLNEDHLLIYKPKDIVSGDFYWMTERGGKSIIAVADCTGHGVPGGFMTMLGINSLNNIVLERGVNDPAEILGNLDLSLKDALGRSACPMNDGMDIAICVIDRDSRTLSYSGALGNLYRMNGHLTMHSSGRQSVGGSTGIRTYTNTVIPLEPGDQYYMCTDGFLDQFGGERNKRYGSKRFKDLLAANAHMTMQEQEAIIAAEFHAWKSEQEQIDDVLVLGFRINV